MGLGIIDHGKLILQLWLWLLLVVLVYKVLLICGGSTCLVLAWVGLNCVCICLGLQRNLYSGVLWINLQLRGSTSRLHVIFKLSYSKLDTQ